MNKKQAEKIALRLLNHKGKTPNKGTKEERQIIEKICRVGKKIGMKFSDESPFDHMCWDGETCYIGTQCVSNIIHEVAHFMVAHPKNRFLPDYALGAGVESGDYPDDLDYFKDPDKIDQEVCASLLGIMWERKYKMNSFDTLYEHNWIYYNDDTDEYRYQDLSSTIDIVIDLYKMGLIDINGRLRVGFRT